MDCSEELQSSLNVEIAVKEENLEVKKDLKNNLLDEIESCPASGDQTSVASNLMNESSNIKQETDVTDSNTAFSDNQAIEIEDVKPTTQDLLGVEQSALSLLLQYNSDSETNDVKDDSLAVNNFLRSCSEKYEFRTDSESDSSSSSSSSSESDDEYILKNTVNNIVDMDDDTNVSDKATAEIKCKGELSVDDLPPIEDLKITVDERECVPLGNITTICDKFVLVNTLYDVKPLDIDSVLFLDKGKKSLGRVFDVLGNVQNPIYCVRFNSNKDINEKEITVGLNVYVAPHSEYAEFIILSEIMKTRGSDASWEHDVEIHPNNIDFSDDEQERIAKEKYRKSKNQTNDKDLNNVIKKEPISNSGSSNGSENHKDINYVKRNPSSNYSPSNSKFRGDSQHFRQSKYCSSSRGQYRFKNNVPASRGKFHYNNNRNNYTGHQQSYNFTDNTSWHSNFQIRNMPNPNFNPAFYNFNVSQTVGINPLAVSTSSHYSQYSNASSSGFIPEETTYYPKTTSPPQPPPPGI